MKSLVNLGLRVSCEGFYKKNLSRLLWMTGSVDSFAIVLGRGALFWRWLW